MFIHFSSSVFVNNYFDEALFVAFIIDDSI